MNKDKLKWTDLEEGRVYKLVALYSGWTFIFMKGHDYKFLKYSEPKNIWWLNYGGFNTTNNKKHDISPASYKEIKWYQKCVEDGVCTRPEHLKGIHKPRTLMTGTNTFKNDKSN
tara:strand:- start:27069 stop:27410 length:342 start_codon:yes stop_codon:yes gene_type:complete